MLNNEEPKKKENIFFKILRIIWKIILYLITNPVFQVGILLLLLNYFGMNLFKHTNPYFRIFY